MIIVTSEYILLNPKLNETNNIKNNTKVEHNKNSKVSVNVFEKIIVQFHVLRPFIWYK